MSLYRTRTATGVCVCVLPIASYSEQLIMQHQSSQCSDFLHSDAESRQSACASSLRLIRVWSYGLCCQLRRCCVDVYKHAEMYCLIWLA